MGLKTPLTQEDIIKLKAGQVVLLDGTIYTARDRAHQRFIEMMKKKQPLPIGLKDKIIYYCGPNIKGDLLGACGPTTASRMDAYTEEMYAAGIQATIGKGQRAHVISELCKKHKRAYYYSNPLQRSQKAKGNTDFSI